MKKSELRQLIREEIKEVFHNNLSRGERKIGHYTSKRGGTYDKFKDDENYIFIKVNGNSITLEGDGEVKTSEEVQKEIDGAKTQSPNKYQTMSNKDFKSMMGRL
jgi:hypothetical protein